MILIEFIFGATFLTYNNKDSPSYNYQCKTLSTIGSCTTECNNENKCFAVTYKDNTCCKKIYFKSSAFIYSIGYTLKTKSDSSAMNLYFWTPGWITQPGAAISTITTSGTYIDLRDLLKESYTAISTRGTGFAGFIGTLVPSAYTTSFDTLLLHRTALSIYYQQSFTILTGSILKTSTTRFYTCLSNCYTTTNCKSVVYDFDYYKCKLIGPGSTNLGSIHFPLSISSRNSNVKMDQIPSGPSFYTTTVLNYTLCYTGCVEHSNCVQSSFDTASYQCKYYSSLSSLITSFGIVSWKADSKPTSAILVRSSSLNVISTTDNKLTNTLTITIESSLILPISTMEYVISSESVIKSQLPDSTTQEAYFEETPIDYFPEYSEIAMPEETHSIAVQEHTQLFNHFELEDGELPPSEPTNVVETIQSTTQTTIKRKTYVRQTIKRTTFHPNTSTEQLFSITTSFTTSSITGTLNFT